MVVKVKLEIDFLSVHSQFPKKTPWEIKEKEIVQILVEDALSLMSFAFFCNGTDASTLTHKQRDL